jgi:hypothetical protein
MKIFLWLIGPRFFCVHLLLHCVEGHGHCPYEYVRDGEGGYEKVCRLPNLPVHDEADEDEEVAKGRDDDADGEADGDEDRHQGAKRGGPTFRTARDAHGSCKKKVLMISLYICRCNWWSILSSRQYEKNKVIWWLGVFRAAFCKPITKS